MNYPMYGNNGQFYMQNLQDMRDRIDNQIRSYQQNQMQQPVQPITQNFQLAPQTNNNELEIKYADNIDAVKNTIVIKTGIFLTKDFSTLWIKDVTGNIRTFKTEEIIEMDEKDKEIYELRKQIKEMEGRMNNANEFYDANVNEPITTKKSTRTSSSSKSNAK